MITKSLIQPFYASEISVDKENQKKNLIVYITFDLVKSYIKI